MENKILSTFFYMNGTLLKIKAFFETDKAFYILAPLLPIYAVFASSTELFNGNFIIFNSIILIFGVIFSFLLMVVSVYHFKSIDVFKLFRRQKSNNNLCKGNAKSNISIKKLDKDISTLITDNKDFINIYFSGIRRIGLVNDDISISDFEDLIANCFMESETDFSFNLEVNANETNGFVREFMLPFLKQIDENNVVNLKKIVSLLNYKKNRGYIKLKESTTKNKKRVFLTEEQINFYHKLKK